MQKKLVGLFLLIISQLNYAFAAQTNWDSVNTSIQGENVVLLAAQDSHYVLTARLEPTPIEGRVIQLAAIASDMPNRYREASIYCKDFHFMGQQGETLIFQVTDYNLLFPLGSEDGRAVNKSARGELSDSAFETDLRCFPSEDAKFVEKSIIYIPNNAAVRLSILNGTIDVRLASTPSVGIEVEHVE